MRDSERLALEKKVDECNAKLNAKGKDGPAVVGVERNNIKIERAGAAQALANDPDKK